MQMTDMEKMPLVSIIIPCYNGAKTLRICLDSVLQQTYKNLEVITVNDGSTDDTEAIVSSYADRFENAGMTLRYVYQENQGLGAAINAGLSVFSGDYLCWIDCDDFMLPESIRLRMEYLESHPEFAVVTSDAYLFDEADLTTPTGRASAGKKELDNPHQFELLLRGKSIFCAGCHMVRSSAFLDVVPQRKIYPARRGQNWQMLLPVYYKYKRVFIDEPLYGYVIHKTSMSAADDTKEKWCIRYREHLDIVMTTLDSIDMPYMERRKYKRIFKVIFARQMLYLGTSYKDCWMLLKYLIRIILLGDFKWSDAKWLSGLLSKRFKRK